MLLLNVRFEDHDAATGSSPFGPLLVRPTLRNTAKRCEVLRGAASQESLPHQGYPLIAWASNEPFWFSSPAIMSG